MLNVINVAVRKFEAHGLRATVNHSEKITVFTTSIDTPIGIAISTDATILRGSQDHWSAVFPGPGQCSYEVPGTLLNLTDLVLAVYEDFEHHQGRLSESFDRVVPDHQRFLRGAYPAMPVSHAPAS